MNTRKINHLWWVIGAAIIGWIIFGNPDKNSLEIVIIIAVPLCVVLIYWIGDYFREKEAYQSALHDIRRNEEDLAEERPEICNKPEPYRKADVKIWKMADAALTCKGRPDSSEYKEVQWNKARKVPWC